MNIVVVEDSDPFRRQLLRLLQAEPRIRVAGIATGEEDAVALVLEECPDAILLDLALASGSGMRVLDRIRRAGCGARVLVLTTTPSSELREFAAAIGISGCYDKETGTADCLAHLCSWLPPLPKNEEARLRAVQGTSLHSRPTQETFDDITTMACEIAHTPMALITVVDTDRQWFLSRRGFERQYTSRSIAFCAHAILDTVLMEVRDTLDDPRFADSPLVVAEPGIRFYAGVPLVLRTGEAIGTLCVLDTQPRELTLVQRRALKTLARSVLVEIDLRRSTLELGRETERRKASEAYVNYLANHDPLTTLPNRAAFREQLGGQIRRTGSGRSFTVLSIDIDHFKSLHEVLGHDGSNKVLIEASKRMKRALRHADVLGRLGGDEFAAIVCGLPGTEAIAGLAGKLLAELAAPFECRGRTLRLAASIGVATYPQDGTTEDQLLGHADIAMLEAKRLGGMRVLPFSRDLDERRAAATAFEDELRAAIAGRDFLVRYQPQVGTTPRRLCGVEALVRWNHPTRGLLGPDQFVPLAEDRDLIVELGALVLDAALAELAAWDAAGVHVPRVAVNVAARELCAGYEHCVEAALARHGLEPARLELEITESALALDGAAARQILTALRERGVSVAIDDFGVGYSGLGQLQRLPVDALKIDRSFVQRIGHSAIDASIVEATLKMAQELGLRTTAEGAETNLQYFQLAGLGCDAVQGDVLGRPMAAAAIPAWIARFEETWHPGAADDTATAAPQDAAVPACASATVLIADHRLSALGWTAATLAPEYRTVLAASASEALTHAVLAPRPDLVVLHANLPDMSCPTVLARLRENVLTRDVPVVVITANGPCDPALTSGADSCLAEPWAPDALLALARARVAHALAKKCAVCDADPALCPRPPAAGAIETREWLLRYLHQELRTPLGHVMNSCELLQDEPLTPQQHAYVENIAHGAWLLLGAVSRTLEIVETGAGCACVTPTTACAPVAIA